jgi:hypothetical protein
MAGDLDRAQQLADQSMALERAVGDPARLALPCLLRATAARYRGDVDDGTAWVVEARRHLGDADDGAATALAHFNEANLALIAGDARAACAGLEAAVAGFAAVGDVLGSMISETRLAEAGLRVGDLEVVERALVALRQLGRDSRSPAATVGATARLASVRLRQGRVAEARALAEDALAAATGGLGPVTEGFALHAAAAVNLETGHLPEGRAQLVAAVDAFSGGIGSLGRGYAAQCWLDLSASYSATDERDDAERAADAARAAAAASRDVWVIDRADAHGAQLGAR